HRVPASGRVGNHQHVLHEKSPFVGGGIATLIERRTATAEIDAAPVSHETVVVSRERDTGGNGGVSGRGSCYRLRRDHRSVRPENGRGRGARRRDPELSPLLRPVAGRPAG